jgi:hypothetical protein
MKTQSGEAVIVLHQYAYTGKGKMIQSSGQLEWYKQHVDDRSVKEGGKQPIKTLDGYYNRSLTSLMHCGWQSF